MAGCGGHELLNEIPQRTELLLNWHKMKLEDFHFKKFNRTSSPDKFHMKTYIYD